ncbi:MAG TPA: serine/threonine-protein kinase [Kofleriaceae bacterium]|nr:serine/threonine-protein kinase [Kofleriaceae bacterium]
MGSDDDGQASTIGAPARERASQSRISVNDLRTGSMIGRYRLVNRLGAGAMGVVWSAEDPQLDRKIAIKLVHPSLSRTPEASARLLREARAMAKLSHRSVVTVHDAGDVDGQLFLAMELVQGTNLGTMLRTRDAAAIADWQRWLALMIDAGRGLAAAHEAGVLHRDFKPDNVLVDQSFRVCVGDFGLASLGVATRAEVTGSSDESADLDLTTTGALLGTPAYMSPQQLRGETIDARADQFSFCVACWEALYGTRPFTVTQGGLAAIGSLMEEIEKGVLPDPPPGSTVPDGVREVIARGLAADPSARWPSMASLVAALERAGNLARRPSTATGAPRRRISYLIAAGVVAVGLGAGVYMMTRGAEKTEPSQPAITAKRLFSVSVRSAIALSSDGKRLALSSDRLEVLDLQGTARWSAPLGPGDVVASLEIDGDSVRFSRRGTHKLERWSYAGDDSITTEMTDLHGEWYAHTSRGEIVLQSHDLLLVDQAGREIQRWKIDGSLVGLSVSPDGRRVATIETDRFAGWIIVRDLETDRMLRSEPIASPTTLSWRDDTTLVYGRGDLAQPRILRVTVGQQGFGTPVEIYGLEQGWFGRVAAHGTRICTIELHPAPRARVVDRTKVPQTQDFDTESVALGWTATGEILTWSRSTGRIERRGTSLALTKAALDAEPASATTTGDIVIAAVRRPQGREAIAQSLTDGRLLWRHGDHKTLAVRCASDRHPPCFAIRTGEKDQIFSLDPDTGALGPKPIFTGKVEDIAVNEDGSRLLLASADPTLHEIDATGAPVAAYETQLTSTRSVAYDPTGGILIAGAKAYNNYEAGVLRDGNFTALVQADDDILSLVRPSPDGTRIVVLARVYSPDLWELTAH